MANGERERVGGRELGLPFPRPADAASPLTCMRRVSDHTGRAARGANSQNLPFEKYRIGTVMISFVTVLHYVAYY